jgi:transcriptional regulator with XRE-family HTH domain
MERFPEKLRTLRERQGMTQQKLAQELGFTGPAHVNRLETGKKHPNVQLILKLSHIFNVTPNQLLLDDLDI